MERPPDDAAQIEDSVEEGDAVAVAAAVVAVDLARRAATHTVAGEIVPAGAASVAADHDQFHQT